jgi:hypothetical protein
MDKVKIDEYFNKFIDIICVLQKMKTKKNKFKSIIDSPLIIELLPINSKSSLSKSSLSKSSLSKSSLSKSSLSKSSLSKSSLSKSSLSKSSLKNKSVIIGGFTIRRRLEEHVENNRGIIDLMSDNGMRYFYYNIITYIFDNFRIPAPHTILLHVSLYAFLISFIISLLQNNPITIIHTNTITNEVKPIEDTLETFSKFIKISDIGDIDIVGFNNSDECSICLNKYNTNKYKKVIVTPCKHYMCRNCINTKCNLVNADCYKCPFCNNVIKYGLL